MSPRLSRRFWLLTTLAILFFCSGVCALIYQVLWLRMLGWVFGVTVYAASAVWATFMAGLGIGSFAAGKVGDRARSPLRWFGVIEILIGATALATPAVLAGLQQVYVAAYPSLPRSLGALPAVRLVIAFAALIVPTALMGTTLPLVVKGSDFRSGVLGGQVGLLYGSNAAGAIVGTLAAGLYLIPFRGIHGTFLAAAGLNLLVGVGAIALSVVAGRTKVDSPGPTHRSAPTTTPSGDPLSSIAVTTRVTIDGRRLLIVLAVFTLSGVISMALEVVWFRVLTLFLRPTVYGFAVMLATVLTGISLGSYMVTPWLGGRARWMFALAALELAIGVAAVLSFQPITYLLPLSTSITPIVSRVLPEYLAYPIAGSLLAIFPTALLMGMAFPIGLYLWTGAGTRQTAQSAERLSLFYSLNVAGGIVGSLVAGFVLLPRLGSRASLILLAAASFGSGLVLLSVSEARRPLRIGVGLAASVVFAAAVWFSPNPFIEFIRQRYPRDEIVWQEEGVEATVFVQRRGNELLLTVNGNHEASTGEAMTYVHRRIGHLPMAIHPNARAALVIGLGGGATAGAVSVHDGVAVDIVELAGAVVRGAQRFESINYGVLSRPNVKVRVDDGRNYLMLTPKRYDVVTADIIHPIFAGSGNLYSAEYFRLMRRVLKPGGIAMQWVAGTEAEYKMITRTFLSVFPETTAWVAGGLLVGSMEPLRLRRSDFEKQLKQPGHAQGLHDLNIESFDSLLAAFTAGPDELRAFVGPGPVLTDDRPLTEYFLSLPRDRDPDFTSLKGDVRRYVVPD
jgi:spermidine synthase